MKFFWSFINIFEESVLVFGMGMMIFLNFANVVCRYLLPQTPFSYTEELVVIIFVWVSMFGISYGYRKGSHTLLTIFFDALPSKLKFAVVIFSAAASALLMFILAYTGYGMVLNQIKFGQILPGMRIPMAVVGWAVPVGAALTFLSILKSGWDEIKRLEA